LILIKRVRVMAKVWKDANEVIKMIHELPNEKLKKYDKEMQKKPKKWDEKIKTKE
jgi:predicted AAA+ superfamily ATPase